MLSGHCYGTRVFALALQVRHVCSQLHARNCMPCRGACAWGVGAWGGYQKHLRGHWLPARDLALGALCQQPLTAPVLSMQVARIRVD
jgi:hypothetical protein